VHAGEQPEAGRVTLVGGAPVAGAAVLVRGPATAGGAAFAPGRTDADGAVRIASPGPTSLGVRDTLAAAAIVVATPPPGVAARADSVAGLVRFGPGDRDAPATTTVVVLPH
jgi:hypothetical protein